MQSITQIIQQMFRTNTILFEGFVMIAITIILTILITRNTRKIQILMFPITIALFVLGIQAAYWFMALCVILYVIGIWSNEFDEKELELDNLGGF